MSPPDRAVPVPGGGTPDQLKVALLGAFELSAGAIPVVLPGSAQRLLALLALRDRAMTREVVSHTLWPDASAEHARGSLRTALSRLDETTRSVLRVNALDLSLTEPVEVDLRASRALAHRLVIVDTVPNAPDLARASIEALSSDLLPDWYDEWALVEAEQWHQLRAHALEVLAGQLTERERFSDAIDASLAAIAAEPLRESGYAALIRVHLAEGNQSEALQTYERYRALLRAELGLAPTPQLSALIGHLRRE